MKTRWIVLLCLALSAALGFLAVAPLLERTVVGLGPSAFPLGDLSTAVAEAVGIPMVGVAATLGAAIAIGVVAGIAVAAARRRDRVPGGLDRGRRGFLAGVGAGLASGGLAFGAAFVSVFRGVGREGGAWQPVFDGVFRARVPETHPEWHGEWKGARVRSHRRLGRTGFEVSDIVLGSGRIRGEAGERVAREAFERGINYVDTAPDYSETGSEQAVGRALRGVRDRIFVATKFCTPKGHLPAGSPVAAYKRVIEDSLRRLGTDRVDLAHVHSCNSEDRLLDPNLHEAVDRLREEGKLRFLGFSSHTPRLVPVARAAIASGRFDVMMLAYHHGIWPAISEVIAEARRERDMGVVAMKTLKGAKHRDLSGFGPADAAYSQAALRWTLSNDDVSCAVISFYEPQHVDEYLWASGGTADARDLAVLREYDRRTAGTYCAPHCGACLGACPEGLPIDDVLRYRMYFEDYGWEKEGMRQYARLAKDASVCAGCAAPCTGACPLGVPIQERMAGAHDLLTL